jgi:hypothetical protein
MKKLLAIAQRDDRIDFRCAAGGQVTRDQSYDK